MKAPAYLLVALLVELYCVHGASVTPPPTAASKPGNCPIVTDLALGACFNKCNNDSECEDNRKCCKTSCDGYQCQIPNDKPGSCPVTVGDATCDPTAHCSSDSKCEGHQKCCATGCNGASCQNPVQNK